MDLNVTVITHETDHNWSGRDAWAEKKTTEVWRRMKWQQKKYDYQNTSNEWDVWFKAQKKNTQNKQKKKMMKKESELNNQKSWTLMCKANNFSTIAEYKTRIRCLSHAVQRTRFLALTLTLNGLWVACKGAKKT